MAKNRRERRSVNWCLAAKTSTTTTCNVDLFPTRPSPTLESSSLSTKTHKGCFPALKNICMRVYLCNHARSFKVAQGVNWICMKCRVSSLNEAHFLRICVKEHASTTAQALQASSGHDRGNVTNFQTAGVRARARRPSGDRRGSRA